jgi:hypothetical protein
MMVNIFILAIGIIIPAIHQYHSVRSVEAVYGRVMFDYHRTESGSFDYNARSFLPRWADAPIVHHLFHRVVYVDLDSPHVDDSTLLFLTGLPNLEYLHIGNTTITPDGLPILEALPNLRVLWINTDGIDDDRAIAHIAMLRSLERLEIDNANNVTDVGLNHLMQAKELRWLVLIDTKVTEAGVERLKDALPRCEIMIDHFP